MSRKLSSSAGFRTGETGPNLCDWRSSSRKYGQGLIEQCLE
ncbi:unnamed protein product [Choristocarpus tenellus]